MEPDLAGFRERREAFRVPAGDLALLLDEAREPLHLCYTHCRLEVGHPVVVAHHLVPVRALGVHTVIAQESEALGQHRVVRDAHPSLASSDDLVAVEREAADAADRAYAPAAVLGAVGLGG